MQGGHVVIVLFDVLLSSLTDEFEGDIIGLSSKVFVFFGLLFSTIIYVRDFFMKG